MQIHYKVYNPQQYTFIGEPQNYTVVTDNRQTFKQG